MIKNHKPEYVWDVTRKGQGFYNSLSRENIIFPTLIFGGSITVVGNVVGLCLYLGDGNIIAGSIVGGVAFALDLAYLRGFLFFSTKRKKHLREISNAYLSMNKADRKKYRKQMRLLFEETKNSGDTYYHESAWQLPYNDMLNLFELKAEENPNSDDSYIDVIRDDLKQAKEELQEKKRLQRMADQIRKDAEIEVAKIMRIDH